MLDRQPHICIALVLQYLDEYDLYCCSCACRVLHDVAEPFTKIVKKGSFYNMLFKRQVYSFEEHLTGSTVYNVDKIIRYATTPVQLYAIYRSLKYKDQYVALLKQCIKLRCYRLLKRLNAAKKYAHIISQQGARVNDERILSLINKHKHNSRIAQGYARAGNVAMLMKMDITRVWSQKLLYYAYMSRNDATIEYVAGKVGINVSDPLHLLYIAIAYDDASTFMTCYDAFLQSWASRCTITSVLERIIKYDAVKIVMNHGSIISSLIASSPHICSVPSQVMCKALITVDAPMAFKFLLRYMIYDIVLVMKSMYAPDIADGLNALTECSNEVDYMFIMG